MTIALLDLPEELDMDRWETVTLLSEGNIPYRAIDGEIYVESEDVFDFLYDRLFTANVPERQLELMVDHYVNRIEDSRKASQRLCYVINYLHHEDPEQLERLMDYAADEFYELTRPYNAQLIEKGDGMSIVSDPGFRSSMPNLSERKEVRRKRADIKEKAGSLVSRVSKYFDIDLPTEIRRSKGEGRYASIRYGPSSGFTDLEVT